MARGDGGHRRQMCPRYAYNLPKFKIFIHDILNGDRPDAHRVMATLKDVKAFDARNRQRVQMLLHVPMFGASRMWTRRRLDTGRGTRPRREAQGARSGGKLQVDRGSDGLLERPPLELFLGKLGGHLFQKELHENVGREGRRDVTVLNLFPRSAARKTTVKIGKEECLPVLNVKSKMRGVGELASDPAFRIMIDDMNGPDAQAVRAAEELADVESAETTAA